MTATSRRWPARRRRSTPAPPGARRSGRGWPTTSGSCPARSTTTTAFDTLAADAGRAARTAHGIQGNAAFYLSIPPAMFPVVLKQMQRTGMADNAAARRLAPRRRREAVRPRPAERHASSTSWSTTCSPPQDVFRIDHYLGKETVQNLLALRFANTLFEPVWNAQLRRLGADHDGRGRRHRQPGRLLRHGRRRPRRAAEPPAAAAGADRDGGAGRASTPRRSAPRRLKVLGRDRAARPTSTRYAVRGQYDQGWLAGERVVGLPSTRRTSRRTRRPRPTPPSGSASRPAAGPACRSTCAPASGCRAGSPRSRSSSRRRRTCRSPPPTPRSSATTSWSSGCSRTRA